MSAQPAKHPPFPVLLIANDLISGDVVFRTKTGWTRNPREALIANADADADALVAAGRADLSRQIVVDPYLVDVVIEAGLPIPRHYRERMRILGPSVRTDLGKQAEFAIAI